MSREALGKGLLRNAILIFDEGHNIEGVCEGASSFELEGIELEAAAREVDDAIDMVQTDKCLHLLSSPADGASTADGGGGAGAPETKESLLKLLAWLKMRLLDLARELEKMDMSKALSVGGGGGGAGAFGGGFGGGSSSREREISGVDLYQMFERANLSPAVYVGLKTAMDRAIACFAFQTSVGGLTDMATSGKHLEKLQKIFATLFDFRAMAPVGGGGEQGAAVGTGVAGRSGGDINHGTSAELCLQQKLKLIADNFKVIVAQDDKEEDGFGDGFAAAKRPASAISGGGGGGPSSSSSSGGAGGGTGAASASGAGTTLGGFGAAAFGGNNGGGNGEPARKKKKLVSWGVAMQQADKQPTKKQTTVTALALIDSLGGLQQQTSSSAEDLLPAAASSSALLNTAGPCSTKKLCFWCFTSSPAMSDLVNTQKARNILITSGTLTPLSSTQASLGIPFGVTLENTHVIDPARQIYAAVLCRGPKAVELSSSYQNRFNENYMRDLGQSLVTFCRECPDGYAKVLVPGAAMEKVLPESSSSHTHLHASFHVCPGSHL